MKKKHSMIKPYIHKSEKNKNSMLLLIFQIAVTILTIENAGHSINFILLMPECFSMTSEIHCSWNHQYYFETWPSNITKPKTEHLATLPPLSSLGPVYHTKWQVYRSKAQTRNVHS